MSTAVDGTDMGMGFAALFGLLAAGSALLMLIGGDLASAFGFGAAIVFGMLLIVALHVYE
jgi:hypothetical protein